ncbi:MAG: queuosine precursor transporter [Tannerellaceae bacterium]|jgi:uncharacterized integral membrane protein (TIGR00697 family)|nr:queuosine precursor transporter [Tannerellaceae bacterium]
MKQIASNSLMVLSVVFSICLVASNLLATKTFQAFGITATAGVLVFPLSYIVNDCIVEVWGFSAIRRVIWTGFAANLLVIVFSQLAILLPGAPFWMEHEEGFNFVFGLAPRIAFASLAAFVAGSFVNARIMSRMKQKAGEKHFSVRAMVSTLAGETVDSAIFFPIAFLGIMPPEVIAGMVLTQAALKSAYEAVILPVTVRVVNLLKKHV